MKKKQIAFTVADEKQLPWAKMLENSLRKFHTEEELPLVIVTGEELQKKLKDYPEFYYRQKPIIASELIDQYDLVLGLDADQIIMGDLNHILDDTSYDVGTVLNFNRTDYKELGAITTYMIDCSRYMNAGFIAMRSKSFVEHWKRLCATPDIFANLQYREQDILNILYYFGDYKVKCFDFKDEFLPEQSWHGLISWGEWLKFQLKDGRVILPKSPDGYPTEDVIIKAIHYAHAGMAGKMNYKLHFTEEMIKHIDWLVGGKK